MTRSTKTSRKRTATTRAARATTTPARANEQQNSENEKQKSEGEAEEYAGAFARVRLVRAWVAVTAAVVAMLYAYVALLERVERWWSSSSARRAMRLAAAALSTCSGTPQLVMCQVARRRRYWARAALLVMGALATAVPRPLHAVDGRRANRAAHVRPHFSYVTITHSGNGTASVYTNNTGSTTFTVRNDGDPLTALFSASICTGNITNCSVSPTGTYLSTGASTTVTVSFTGGTTAGSGQLRLTARDASDNSVMNYYDVGITVTVDPNAPTVDLSPHLGDRRDVSQCVADCFESTLSYTTPAYVSLDVPRSVTLLYRSGRAYPHGTLTLDASSSTAPTGSTFRLQLVDQNGGYVTFTNGAQALYFARATSGPTRIVAQFKADTIPTSARLYTARVSTMTSGGSVFGTTIMPVRIIVINDRNSPYGAGVSLVGVQRISFNQPDGALVTDGSGSATFFAGSCNVNTTCSYTSPSGEFSTLSTSGGFFYRGYPDGTQMTYYQGGHHRGTSDRFGNTTLVDYAWNGSFADYVPTAITDPTGQVIALNYRDAASAGTTYLVGSLGQISVQQGARLSNFGVMPAGNLEYLVDADGVCCDVASYDGQHRLTQVTSKGGAVISYAYRYGATLDSTEAPAVVLDGGITARPRVLLRNAADALLVGAASGSGTSGSPLAVPSDLRAAVTDAAGSITYFSLSRFGSPTKTKAPLIPVDSNEYDANTGQLLRNISPTGHDVRYTYDAGKLTSVYDVTEGQIDSIWYAGHYALPMAIKGTHGEQWFWYDSLKTGWPLKKSAPTVQGPFTMFYADSFGRDSVIDDPLGHRTSYTYETTGLRNRASVRTPNNQVTSFTHDAAGRAIGMLDPYGITQHTGYDVLNRTKWTASSAYADTTRFHYDALNADTMVVDAKGQTYKFLRNALGWTTKQTMPGSGSDSIAYDVAGRVAYTRSRAGREIRFTYDSLGRLTKRTGLGTQSVDSIWYDLAGTWTAAQSKIGSTIISTDTLQTDEPNQKVKEMTHRSSGSWRVESTIPSGSPGRSSAFLYKRVANSDSTATYTYFNYSPYWVSPRRLASIQGPTNTTSFYYNSDDLVDSVSLRSGLTETFGYTSSHELSSRAYVGASWVDDVFRRWYRTDSLARLTARGRDTLFQTFEYDSVGRLRTWKKEKQNTGVTCISGGDFGYTCSGTAPTVLSQVSAPHDKVGNPSDAGAVTATGNRLTSFNGVTMTYDADGYLHTRVTSTTTDSLTWDEFGRLVSVKRVGQSQPTTFAYDGFGRRIRKTSAAVGSLEYLWDGDQIMAEVDGSSGAMVQTYTYDPGIDQPRSVTANGQTYFMSKEPDGSVDGLIKESDRTVAAQYTYTPWGEFDSPDQQLVDSVRVNSLRWKGLPYDPETGLYYMRARYYDPQTRRFISEDPIGLEGGINMYVFGDGDPVNRSDPAGLFDCWKNYMPGVTMSTVSNGETISMGESEGYWVIMCQEATAQHTAETQNPLRVNDTGHGAGGGTSWLPQRPPTLSMVGPKTQQLIWDMTLGFTGAGLRASPKPPIAGVLTGYRKHGIDQAISRDGVGVTYAAILAAVKQPLKVVQQTQGRLHYVGENASVILNSAGEVITTWARNSTAWRIRP
jgi:RHS repeat-associated protein